jgi:hypothetical protein
MKALGDYIHSKGLKFGIYGDRGTETLSRDNFKELDTKVAVWKRGKGC